MHGIAAITGNMHRSLRYFVLLEYITSIGMYAYVDDGTLMGSPDALASALAFVEREGPSLGLFLNRSKSLLFVPEEADLCHSTLSPDIPITRRGFSLLGCPVGPPDFCDEVFLNRIQKVKASLHALSDLTLSSSALFSVPA